MKAGAGDKNATTGGADSPLFPPMASKMKVDFLFNDEGGVWLLHDKPLPPAVLWAEYDADFGSVSIVTESGRIMEMGLKVAGPFGICMQTAKELTALLVNEQAGAVMDFTIIPIVIRNTTVN